jgi:hypothetical protein
LRRSSWIDRVRCRAIPPVGVSHLTYVQRNAIAALLLLMAPGVARADWEYAHWGMKPEEVAQASGGAVKVLPPAKWKRHPAPFDSETAATGTFTEGALHLTLSFSFDPRTKGLTCIVFNSTGQDDLFRDSFLHRYGTPRATADHPEYGMKTFEWRGRDEVGLTLMAGASFATQCLPGTIPPIE